MKYFLVLLFFSMAAFAGSLLAEEETRNFESGDSRVSLLELYTSEGCSSCPPADSWIRKLKHDRRLWREIIPVSFHVDYWDSLGWKDRYASATFSRRQRHYAAVGGAESVYTPGFFVNGKEWRGFFRRQDLPSRQQKMPGLLKASIRNNNAEIVFAADSVALDYDVNIAVLGFDLNSVIRTGENSGKTLQHDFVVVGHVVKPLAKNGRYFQLNTELPDHDYREQKLGFAAWVTQRGSPTPIQAVGGWLN